ncbi:MAG: hypothetical protein GW938_06240 [Leptospira sp.]|nr:hypothetical protein [Leptospira sp.]NCS92649.1 hypothetical protein [Leptospira sp.]
MKQKQSLIKSDLVSMILFCLFSYSCTFGSVGDSKEEEALILQNLLRVSREIPSSLNMNLLSYDTQSDDDLNNFTLVSNGITYSIAMNPYLSFIDFNRVEFRFNPNDKIAGLFSVKSDNESKEDNSILNINDLTIQNENVSKTHTPFTVPLDLPADDPYGKIYSISGSRINSYSNQNSNGIGLGSVNQQDLGNIPNAPQGVVASTEVYFDRLDLRANISRTVPAAQNRNIILSIRDVHITLPTRCRINMEAGKATEYYLGFRYSSLFRDVISSSSNIYILDTIVSTGTVNGSDVIITDLDSTYTNYIKNFELPDNVFVQETCNL